MSNEDKRADEIIEETMKEIFEDLNHSDAFKETEEEHETAKEKETAEKNEDHRESADSDGLSSDDDLSGRAGSNEEIEEAEEIDDSEAEDLDVDEADNLDDADDVLEEKSATSGKTRRRRGRRGKKNGKSAGKTAVIIIGCVFGVFVLVYVGFAIFFHSHFLFNTTINDTDFSLQSVSQVNSYMKQQVADYVLTMEESDGSQETITGEEIALEYVEGDELEKLVKNQNHFLWITSLWDYPSIEAEIGVTYDEEALEGVISRLDCMQEENQTASVDAYPEFKDGQFVVAPEVVGTQIDTETFHQAVASAINGFQPELNLMETGCYILPKYTSGSEEVRKAVETMNSYLGANITYDFNPYTEVVDASVISQWVKADGDLNVTFDEEAVKAYVASLAEKYNTKGKTRTFTTATGNVVTVEGGSYGWRIDQETEYNALIANIQNAETVTREPNYSSRAASHGDSDVGNTYAEVDLTNQCMYYIQNGQVVLQSEVVTGNTSQGNGTPQGVYPLAYKARDQVLRGEKKPDGTYEYESPVSYWMPFNGGIGFHDANWRGTFGGTIYQSNGSHGCVNMPPAKAAELYDLISAGIPVVCHY